MKRRRRCGSRLRRFLFPLRDEKPGIEFEPGLYVVDVARSDPRKYDPVYLFTSRAIFGSTWRLTKQSVQMLAFDRSASRSFTIRGQELRNLFFEGERQLGTRRLWRITRRPVISSTPSHTVRKMSTIASPRASGAWIGTLQPKRRVVQANTQGHHAAVPRSSV